jgi:hypothetical protein
MDAQQVAQSLSLDLADEVRRQNISIVIEPIEPMNAGRVNFLRLI